MARGSWASPCVTLPRTDFIGRVVLVQGRVLRTAVAIGVPGPAPLRHAAPLDPGFRPALQLAAGGTLERGDEVVAIGGRIGVSFDELPHRPAEYRCVEVELCSTQHLRRLPHGGVAVR